MYVCVYELGVIDSTRIRSLMRTLVLSAVGRYSEKMAPHKPGSGSSLDTKSTGHLSSTFQPLEP